MMHSHKFHTTGMSVLENEVLILVVMDDALARSRTSITQTLVYVLILVVMDDALAHDDDFDEDFGPEVLILVVMDDALAPDPRRMGK